MVRRLEIGALPCDKYLIMKLNWSFLLAFPFFSVFAVFFVTSSEKTSLLICYGDSVLGTKTNKSITDVT